MEYDGDDSSWFLVRSQISNAGSALCLENATWEVCVPVGGNGKPVKSHMQASYEYLRLPLTSTLLRVLGATGPTGYVYWYKEIYLR